MLLYEWEVRASINDKKPSTKTWATSEQDAKSHIFNPEHKEKLRKSGVIIVTSEDVERLCFRKTDRVKPPKKQQKFYWYEDGEFTDADRTALLKH